MGLVFTQIPSLTVWNTWLIRILRGNECLAGKNLQIAAVAGRRDVGSSGSKFTCPRENMKDFSGD